MITVGWDVGGAHLKAAALDETGLVLDVVQLPCPLWQGLDKLEKAIADTVSRLPKASSHAVTMTGELVDLFVNRATGVMGIAQTCAGQLGETTRFWDGTGFVTLTDVERNWRSIASANWLATAGLCARNLPDLLVMDMGSTTTDLVAVHGSRIRAQGLEDGDRMITGELVYTGVVRTPLMALGPKIEFRGTSQYIAAEYFCTTGDAYRLLGKSLTDQYPTADGKGTSLEECARRLARMVGRDLEDATLPEWQGLAGAFAGRQLGMIRDAALTVLAATPLPPLAPIVGAGQGAFNAKLLAEGLGRPYQPITNFLRLSAGAEGLAETAVTAIAVGLLSIN